MRQVGVGLLLLCLALVGGCANHEKAVRTRAGEFINHLCRDEFDACIKLTEPGFVRGQGEAFVKLRYQAMRLPLKLGGLTEKDIRVEQVTLAPDAKAADVRVAFRVKDAWQPQSLTYKWVRVDGQWYITF